MSLVLLTGAAGRIGAVLRGGLPVRGRALCSLDVAPLPDERQGEEQVAADVTDLAAPADAVHGVDAVGHTAGLVGEAAGQRDLAAARASGSEPADDAEMYAEAPIEAHCEPDPTDPVHSLVGGRCTPPAFDAENVEAAGGRL